VNILNRSIKLMCWKINCD